MYIFSQRWEREGERHSAVQNVWDAATTRLIEDLGIQHGWSCLEVGGGGGSMTRWLCQRVGETGHVMATDLDTRFLEEIKLPQLTVRQHDITRDPLPEAAFDLVHARLVLENVADPIGALRNMVSALKPGGLVLVEDYDFPTRFTYPEHPVAKLVNAAHEEDLRSRGGDPECGRKLHSYLTQVGLKDVFAHGQIAVYRAGHPATQARRLGLEQRRERFVERNLLTNEQIDAFLDLLNDQTYTFMSPVLFAAWGYKS